MTISYKFDLIGGQTFYCKTFEDLENYHDIVYIDCQNNNLSVLPNLPHSLEYLNCSYNHLTALPTLPNSLTSLYCHYNRLTVLPTLPNSLEYLGCWNNELHSLPTLPNGLTILDCKNNLLSFLPVLPDSLEDVKYHKNPVRKYIKEKCGSSLDIYHRVNEIFANKVVRWYLDCRENPKFKFCRTRLNKQYDALMEEDTGGIMG